MTISKMSEFPRELLLYLKKLLFWQVWLYVQDLYGSLFEYSVLYIVGLPQS